MPEDKLVFLQQVKQQNMSKILTCIWQWQSISRVELVKYTHLTSGTITNLVHELIEMKVIREFESVSGNVGRRRIMLGFDLNHYRLLGLDIGRTSYEVVVLNLAGKVLKSVSRDIPKPQGPRILDEITPLMKEIITETEKAGHQILGLGAGLPGPMDYASGTLLTSPNFPGWTGYPILRDLRERFGQTTMIEDDSRTSALAERWYGHGRQVENLIFVTMGVGIGGGVVWNGKIVWGTNGLCGQVGHMTIEKDGKECECGNRGCWETVGSIPGILSRWTGGTTMEQLADAVSRGEREAVTCMQDTIDYLETALINIYNFYDPELIVLGGKLYPYLSGYIDAVRNRLRKRIFAFAQNRLRVEVSSFGTSQSAVGAASVLFAYLLNEPLNLLARSNETLLNGGDIR